jgi:hypothetical protein
MAFAFLGNSPLQKWGIPVCNFGEFYLAQNIEDYLAEASILYQSAKSLIFDVAAIRPPHSLLGRVCLEKTKLLNKDSR